MYTRVFVDGGIQCTEQCTERCIYTREIIAIGGALVSSRYIDLPSLPNTEDFLLRRRRRRPNTTDPLHRFHAVPPLHVLSLSLSPLLLLSSPRYSTYFKTVGTPIDGRLEMKGEGSRANWGKYSRNSLQLSPFGRWIVGAFVTEETIIAAQTLAELSRSSM